MSDDATEEDKIIANELSKLSWKERELAYEDLHGVTDVISESPELIEKSLKELSEALKQIEDKPAYNEAMLQSRDYVWDRKFCLKFLRAAQFDSARAAARMVEYFAVKLDLFGTDKLSQEITLEDLGEDGLEALKFGAQQILPSRDSQGRAIVVGHQAAFFSLFGNSKFSLQTLKKTLWYFMSCAFDDEETQKRGVVFISYAVDSNPPSDQSRFELLKACTFMGGSVPGRISAGNYCYRSSNAALLWKAVVFGAGAFLRVRLRAHGGTHSECMYSLLSFGIPVRDFPISNTGELKRGNHLKWIDRRRKKELYLSSSVSVGVSVDIPAKYDVLLGRGKPFNQHWGNKRFHEIVADRYDEYDRRKRSKKTQYAQEVVDYVHGYGARFFKQDEESGMWIEADNLEARNKVAHGFRRFRETRLNAAKSIPAIENTENLMSETEPVTKKRAVTVTNEPFFSSLFFSS